MAKIDTLFMLRVLDALPAIASLERFNKKGEF